MHVALPEGSVGFPGLAAGMHACNQYIGVAAAIEHVPHTACPSS